MSAHSIHQIVNARGPVAFATDRHRREKPLQCCPRGLRPFLAVEGSFAGGALAPTFHPVAIDNARQNNATFSGAAETGFEKVDEWQANLTEFNRFNDHRWELLRAAIMPLLASIFHPCR